MVDGDLDKSDVPEWVFNMRQSMELPVYSRSEEGQEYMKEDIRELISKSMFLWWEKNPDAKKKLSELMKTKYPHTIEKAREAALIEIRRRVAEGTWVGWKSRPKGMESYPESYWRQVLERENIPFIQEKRVQKRELGVDNSSSYFLDFVVESSDGKLIDIEIDGGQHLQPDIMERDRIRDGLLIKSGFIVHRIKWIDPSKHSQSVQTQIEELLALFSSYGVTGAPDH